MMKVYRDQYYGLVVYLSLSQELLVCARLSPSTLKSLEYSITNEDKLLQRFLFYAPNFEKVGSILVSACPFVRLFKKNFKLWF